MKVMNNIRAIAIATLLFWGYNGFAQKSTNNLKTKNTAMKTYVIEREIPNAGNLTAAELKAASQNSCSVLTQLGPDIEWDHSYVTGNKIYCIYRATSEEIIRKHAKMAGLPANSIAELKTVISPETAK